MTENATLNLSPYEVMLLAAAIDGLAAQLSLAANRLTHGPQQVEACQAVGTLRQIARRLPADTAQAAADPKPAA